MEWPVKNLCVNNEDAREIDRKAMIDLHYPGNDLMERAGTALGKYALKLIHEKALRKALVFCGKGNNGGDGYVAAACLKQNGIDTRCICLANADQLKGDAAEAYRKMSSTGVPAFHIKNAEEIRDMLNVPALWVDALFGTGMHSAMRGLPKDVLTLLKNNRNGNIVAAADIPSGIDGNNGLLRGPVLAADLTVSMGFYKWGQFLQGARNLCGKIVNVPLPYPDGSYSGVKSPGELCNNDLIDSLLQPEKADSHKYQMGQLTVIGGSASMPGAPAMAGKAAMKCGVGMLHYFCDPQIMQALSAFLPEAILHYRSSEKKLGLEDMASIHELATRTNAWLIGPGLGRSDSNSALLETCLKELDGPFILDADALYFMTPEKLAKIGKKTIITPHFGEFARLFNVDSDKLKEDPGGIALKSAAESNVIIHLKSAGSLTAYPDGRIIIHDSGSPGMATAGSGDVLAGMIAAFCARGYKPENAVLIGAHLHGRAGEFAGSGLGLSAMTATDIISHIPEIMKSFEKYDWKTEV